MGTPAPQSIPTPAVSSAVDATAELITAAVTEALADFNCETPECGNAYRFVSLFVGDSQAHYHCPACWLGWNAAIAKGLIEQGLLEPAAAAGPIAGA